MVVFNELAERDFPFIKGIYDHYILHSTSTYYTDKISIEELRSFIPLGDQKYKSFLISDDEGPCGFCYISRYKKRQAYDRTAEVSIYLKPGKTAQGIGTLAVRFLEEAAKNKGISVLIAIVSGDNELSIRLFEKCGYEKCGHFRQIGEKFGRVLDVVFYQKMV